MHFQEGTTMDVKAFFQLADLVNPLNAARPIPEKGIDSHQPAPAKEYFEYSSMEFYNMDVHRRKGQDATARKYVAQGGGGPSTTLLINESSGAGGGSGGGAGYQKREEEKDQAEVSRQEADSVSMNEIEIRKLFAAARTAGSGNALETYVSQFRILAQSLVPFSFPIFFN